MIIGHQQIISQLRHAVSEDHIAGAYLFAGEPNVGKETVALYFVKSIKFNNIFDFYKNDQRLSASHVWSCVGVP